MSDYESDNQSEELELLSDKDDDADYEINETNNQKHEIVRENNNVDSNFEQFKQSSINEIQDSINNNNVASSYPNEENISNDIILEGYLIYRYSNDQIELEGSWFMSNDQGSERLSYLFLKPNEYIRCEISPEDVEGLEDRSKSSVMKICSSNLFECIIINKYEVFNTVLNYLCGDYSGYFMYYGKTIEDKVSLNFSLQDSLVRING